MGDKEAIGVIVDDLISVLEDLLNDKEISYYEVDSILFGVKILKYLALLCKEEGCDLDLSHEYDNILLE